MASSPGALLRTAMASMTVKEKDDGSDDDDNGSDLGAEQESFFSTSADRIRGNLATIITEVPPGVCSSGVPGGACGVSQEARVRRPRRRV
jgi:hypothetical protein